MEDQNLYAPPKEDASVTSPGGELHRSDLYGGLNRPIYFCIVVSSLFGVVISLLVASEILNFFSPALVFWGFYFFQLVPACYRFKNIGASPHVAWFLLIPIVNIFLIVWCVAAPTGFQDHRNIDLYGGMMLLIGFLLGMLIVSAMF